MTAYYQGKTWIYLEGSKKVFFSNATGNFTKADKVYLQTGEVPYKYDYLGRLNSDTTQNFVWIHSKVYYSFVNHFLYTDGNRDCPPPYND